MRRNLTPRSVSAEKRRRSAGVSAKSSTLQAGPKALRGREFETPESVVDVRRIVPWMEARNLVSPLPQGG